MFKVSFRVMGKDLDPLEISELLGIEPDVSHRAGDPVGTAFSRTSADFREGLWSLESSANATASLDQHIASISSRLGGSADAIAKLKWRGYRVDVFVGVFEIVDNIGVELGSDTLRRISDLSASLNLDLYTA